MNNVLENEANLRPLVALKALPARGIGNSIIGRGHLFIYLCSAQLISFEINFLWSVNSKI